ncbi:hypothetical protein F2P81_014995 [Scophthalmus maximus]|uniref:DUF1899 domain-containing protein n=1 Tax=Scophthalmus maximus TaxID=52904 RepID=A0A6A4SJC7_SCOMX|nr:hypothetical protein F2P81_014995 [Scophthalmus maximus]
MSGTLCCLIRIICVHYGTLVISAFQEWINNVHAGSFSCQGNHIKASSKLVAFNMEQAGGGMLGLSSVKPGPDGQWTVTQISCHSDLITDMDFSPFDEYLLATCSGDEMDKMLRVFDPRAQLTPVQSAKSLQNNKDSRVLWAKDDLLLTTGFDMDLAVAAILQQQQGAGNNAG